MKKENNKAIKQLQIKDVIRKVQEELMESQRERENQGIPPLFEVDALEIELHFTIQQQTGVNAGFSLAVVDLDAEHTYSSEQVQKITLRLKKVPAPGEEFLPAPDMNGSFPNEELRND